MKLPAVIGILSEKISISTSPSEVERVAVGFAMGAQASTTFARIATFAKAALRRAVARRARAEWPCPNRPNRALRPLLRSGDRSRAEPGRRESDDCRPAWDLPCRSTGRFSAWGALSATARRRDESDHPPQPRC